MPEHMQFSSFYAFKGVRGKAGTGNDWHHIVEQNQIKKSGFPAGKVYSDVNTIKLDKATHSKVSGHYKSKSTVDPTKSVRDWLVDKSFEEQYQYGIDYLRSIGVDI